MTEFGIAELIAIVAAAHFGSLDFAAFVGGSVAVVNICIMCVTRS